MRMTRNPKIILSAGTILLATILLIAGILRGQNQYPEPAALAAATPYKNTFFDPDPHHPWNQLYGLLFIRPAWNGEIYGNNEMDPLYWRTSLYLLDPPLNQKALAFLDQFIRSDAAHLIKTPLKRALLQRMLWALFDHWSFFDQWYARSTDPLDRADPGDKSVERRELQVRLVKIMKAVALTDDEIAALPDNYNIEVAAKSYPAAFDPGHVGGPFLPANFFSRTDWVDLGTSHYELVAPVHVAAVSGRSYFHVLISLPTGRDDTLAYLKKLHDFQPHWVYDEKLANHFADGASKPPFTNGSLPQVPLLTKFALVRKADLINVKGESVTSPLTESVQIRVIRSILPNNSSGGEQTFLMFRLDQNELMAGKGGLKAEDDNLLSFDTVLNRDGGRDPLQVRVEKTDWHGEAPRMLSCQDCHDAAGIFSMNSYRQFFQERRTLQPPDFQEGSSWSINWKKERYDWGLLQAYWFAQ
jgi:hypothetical protein